MKEINVIYSIRNIKNGCVYIGSAHNFNKRKYKHLYDLKNNIHHSKRLQNSWNKNGTDCFVFEILERVESRDYLIAKEQNWLDAIKPEYNHYTIAGSSLGYKQSAETKRKMSVARLGRKLSDEHRKKISLAKSNLSIQGRINLSNALKGNKNRLGNIVSEETKRKISIANSNPSPQKREKLSACKIGRKLSIEHKAKIGLIHKGKPWSENRRRAYENKLKNNAK